MGQFQTAITFNKAILSNSSNLPSPDYISGLVGYDSSLPSAWPSSGILECLSVQDAINAGLDGKHEDETAATGTIAVTHVGATGDVYNIYVAEPQKIVNGQYTPNLILLCSYTQLSTDTTDTILGASIAAAITAATVANGGYTATSSSGTITITARPGLGQFLNTGTPITLVTASSSFTSTITQFSSGVGSLWDIFYYHISEYFRCNPAGQLWVGLFAIPSTYNFAEVGTLQTAAGGAIRQVGVYTPARTIVSNSAADIAALNVECTTLDTNKMPLSAILAADIHSVTNLATLPTLAFNPGYDYVSVNISQDGGAQGYALYSAYGKSVTNLGAFLGTLSSISVAASVAQPIANNNISNGTENNTICFANGALFTSVSTNLQTQLDGYNYIYAGYYTGYNGTYFSGQSTCIISTSNYATISENRVENKIERLMYVAYLPYTNGGITLNADGTIFQPQVESLNGVGDAALAPMISANEISQLETVISPTQNVGNTKRLIVTLYEEDVVIIDGITINVNSVTSIPSV